MLYLYIYIYSDVCVLRCYFIISFLDDRMEIFKLYLFILYVALCTTEGRLSLIKIHYPLILLMHKQKILENKAKTY